MVRRIASQVHKQASRLIRAGFLKVPPAWYQAVLEHPPLPLPPREPPSRTSYDYDDVAKQAPGTATATKPKKTPGPRSLPVTYVEDGIRRQFFRDHPFEAFRARCITEAGTIEDEHPVSGLEWTRLNQRGRNPSPEEYVTIVFPLPPLPFSLLPFPPYSKKKNFLVPPIIFKLTLSFRDLFIFTPFFLFVLQRGALRPKPPPIPRPSTQRRLRDIHRAVPHAARGAARRDALCGAGCVRVRCALWAVRDRARVRGGG